MGRLRGVLMGARPVRLPDGLLPPVLLAGSVFAQVSTTPGATWAGVAFGVVGVIALWLRLRHELALARLRHAEVMARIGQVGEDVLGAAAVADGLLLKEIARQKARQRQRRRRRSGGPGLYPSIQEP